MTDELPDAGAFGAAFEDFMHAMTAAATRPESDLAARIREHLGADPRELPSTATTFPATDHPNVQLALDDVLGDAEVLGYSGQHLEMFGVGLNELLSGQGRTGPIALGPVQYTDVPVGDDRVVQCVSAGPYLARRGDAPVAVALSHTERPFQANGIRLEGVSPERNAVGARSPTCARRSARTTSSAARSSRCISARTTPCRSTTTICPRSPAPR